MALAVPAFSQGGEAAEDVARVREMEAALNAAESEQGGGSNRPELAPTLVPEHLLVPEVREALDTSLAAYYEYRTSGFEHRKRVFAWQLFSSKVIFIVVIMLVAAGLYFSWLQFRSDLSRRAAAGQGEEASTTLEAGSGGIKVSSPVLGVIILVISLLFFYLYLVYVYPIEEIL
jgi:hypothetical protein